MRATVGNPKAISETLALRRFQQKGADNAQAAAAAAAEAEAARLERAASLRRDMLSSMELKKRDRSVKLEHDEAVHAALVRAQQDAERRELAVELALGERAQRKKLTDRLAASQEVLNGIEAFEINMKRSAAGEEGGAGGGEGEEDSGAAAAAATTRSPLEQMTKIMSMAPSPGSFAEKTAAYVSSIQSAQSEEVAARKDREVRRRRLLVEQQKQTAEQERRTQLDSLVATLQKQSAEEQRVAARLWQLRQEQAVMEANRSLRQAQYEERRAADWEDTLRIEVQLHRSMRDEYQAAAALEMAAWRQAQAAREAAQAAESEAACRGVAWQLVQLAERCIEYRRTSGTLVPRREFREWLALFHAESPALGDPVLPALLLGGGAAPDRSQVDGLVTAAAVEDWLQCRGEWEASPAVEPNPHVARAVATVSAIAHPVAKPPSDLPRLDVPLRLCVLGAPFSGKTSVCHDLARRYGVKVLSPEGVIAEAVAAGESYTVPKWEPPLGHEDDEPPPPPPTPDKVVLGRAIKPLLQGGQPVPDELLVDLMVAAMVECNDYVPPAADASAASPGKGGAKGKPSSAGKKRGGKDGGNAAHTFTTPQGFVLDGFPRTDSQAVLLERKLTGLNVEAERLLIADASVLVPPPPDMVPEVDRPRRSGLDAVMVLQLEDGTVALKRALGRRVDPLTGRVYHLDFDPPPKNEPGLSERLKLLDEAGGADAVHIQERMTTHVEQGGSLDAWLKKFAKLRRPIEGSGPLADTMCSAQGVVYSVLRAKAAAASASAALEAADKAKESAVQAQAAAEASLKHVERAAQELFTAKTAEVQASAMLSAGKNANPAAADLLKAQASTRIADQLRIAQQSAKDANGYALRASNSATSASDAAQRAQQCVTDADACAAAEAAARASADEAAKAAKEALEAAAKAAAAKQLAVATAAEAEKIAGATELAEDAKPPSVEALAAATAAAVVDAPPPPPPTAQVVPLSEPAGQAMYGEWRAIEASYLEGLRMCFWHLSEERRACVSHFSAVRNGFLSILHRPDQKAAMVSRFTADFNAVDVDLLKSRETVAELVLRSDELRDALWAVCDAKMAENEAERKKIEADGFVADHVGLTAQHFTALLQVEVDRFLATLNFMRAFLHAQYGLVGHGQEPAGPSPDLLAGPVPSEFKDRVDDKSKALLPLPEYGATLAARAPQLATAVRVALSCAIWAQGTYIPNWKDESLAAAGKARGTSAERKAAAAAAKKGPGGKGGEAVDDALAPVLEVVAHDMAEAVAREAAAMNARVHLIGSRAAGHLTDLTDAAQRTATSLVELVKGQYSAECSAVSALDKIIKAAALEGRRLGPEDLRLEDTKVVVDPGLLWYAPPPPPPRPPAKEKELPAGLLSCKQLGELVVALQAAAPSGYCRLQAAAELLCRMAAVGQLPGGWQAAGLVQMLSAVGHFDPTYTGFLDWRELVASLASCAFSSVTAAGPATLAAAAKALADADGDRDGLLTRAEWLGVKTWFELEEEKEAVQSQAVAAGAADAAAASSSSSTASSSAAAASGASTAFNRAAALKEVLWQAFSRLPALDEPLVVLPAPGDAPSAGGDGKKSEKRSTSASKSRVGSAKEAASTGGAAPAAAAPTASARAGTSAPPAPAATLDYKAVLLYLCADPDVFCGLKKAFAVATGSAAPNARATATQILKVAYPLGPKAAQPLGRAPVEPAAMADLVASIYTSRGGDPKAAPAITAEQLMYSATGEKVLNSLMGRYQLKDLFMATKL